MKRTGVTTKYKKKQTIKVTEEQKKEIRSAF